MTDVIGSTQMYQFLENNDVLCTVENCTMIAKYNHKKEKPATYCYAHKTDDMIYIRKLCKHPGCIVMPSFNFPTETARLYCSKHKFPGMVNKLKRNCKFPNCTRISLYNFHLKKPIYCSEHKEPSMVNTAAKLCMDCDKCATFNYPGQKAFLYCSTHKLAGMVRIRSIKKIN
jgi:EsV-1-7 cysteine-rich motif